MKLKTILLTSLIYLNLNAITVGEVPKQVVIGNENGGLVKDVLVMFYIESVLKTKQEEFPNTLYIKDKNSILVKEWGLADDNSDIIIFAKNGKVLFHKDGKMNEEEIQKVFKIIEENL